MARCPWAHAGPRPARRTLRHLGLLGLLLDGEHVGVYRALLRVAFAHRPAGLAHLLLRSVCLGVGVALRVVRRPPEDADHEEHAKGQHLPEGVCHPVELPLFGVLRVVELEIELIGDPADGDPHCDGQRVGEVAVQLQLDGLLAGAQLGERLGEGGEDPEDDDRVQHRHRQHQYHPCHGGQVVHSAHVRDHVQGDARHKVGEPQAPHLVGEAAQRGLDHAVAHGHHQHQHARDRLAQRPKHDRPQRGHDRAQPRGVEVDEVEVPGAHLHHAQEDERGDAVLQRDDVAPVVAVQRQPRGAQAQERDGHVAEEGHVACHHAGQVAVWVLPCRQPLHAHLRQLRTARHKP
mmetsp:Transcript_12728/g.32641  ORF Transcript_12728/g.32641 Transcript_12728/m.32641 type:complete len:347 (+) Transcript_12728:192-1232(+)